MHQLKMEHEELKMEQEVIEHKLKVKLLKKQLANEWARGGGYVSSEEDV